MSITQQPVVKSEAASSNYLPHALTRFIGRRRELEAARHLLRQHAPHSTKSKQTDMAQLIVDFINPDGTIDEKIDSGPFTGTRLTVVPHSRTRASKLA